MSEKNSTSVYLAWFRDSKINYKLSLPLTDNLCSTCEHLSLSFPIYFFPCMLLKNNFQSNEHSVLRYEGNTSSNTHTHAFSASCTSSKPAQHIVTASFPGPEGPGRVKTLWNSYCSKQNPVWKSCGVPIGARECRPNGLNAAPTRGIERLLHLSKVTAPCSWPVHPNYSWNYISWSVSTTCNIKKVVIIVRTP